MDNAILPRPKVRRRNLEKGMWELVDDWKGVTVYKQAEDGTWTSRTILVLGDEPRDGETTDEPPKEQAAID